MCVLMLQYINKVSTCPQGRIFGNGNRTVGKVVMVLALSLSAPLLGQTEASPKGGSTCLAAKEPIEVLGIPNCLANDRGGKVLPSSRSGFIRCYGIVASHATKGHRTPCHAVIRCQSYQLV